MSGYEKSPDYGVPPNRWATVAIVIGFAAFCVWLVFG